MIQKRILVVAGLAESLVNFRGHLIQDLASAGHDVHVAAPGIDGDPQISQRLRELGASPHDIPLKRVGMNPVSDLRTLLALVHLFRTVKPHTVLAYTIKPVVWGGIAARLARVPCFFALITGLGYAFTENAKGARAFLQRLLQVLYRVSLRGASGVIFQNPDDAAEFSDRGLLPVQLAPRIVNGSGVDTNDFSVADFPEYPTRFLLIARLLGDKGIREFAEVARRFKDGNIPAEFHLVGPIDPSPNGLPETTVKQWHADGLLRWHGSLSDVRPAISSAHVYVLPSFYREGTPRTILEAMSMGRPIVTTDAPGCRETVEQGVNGFLVPVRNAEALAEAMRKFVGDPGAIAQMGAQSRRIAEEKYDVRKVNAHMMEAMGL